MSDREALNTRSTRLGDEDNSGLSLIELEAELELLSAKCKAMTQERNEYRSELNSALKQLTLLENRENALMERLDFVEKLIISTLNDDVN